MLRPQLKVQQVRFEFDGDVVTGEPYEVLWQFWWTKIFGAQPVMALTYLHHVATTHDIIDDPTDVLSSMLTPIDAGTSSGIAAVDMLVPLLSYRLAFAQNAGDELQLGLVYPIPRPGRAAHRTIEQQLTAATSGGNA